MFINAMFSTKLKQRSKEAVHTLEQVDMNFDVFKLAPSGLSSLTNYVW